MFFKCFEPKNEDALRFMPLIPMFMREDIRTGNYRLLACEWETDADISGVLVYEPEEEGITVRWCAVWPKSRELGCATGLILGLERLAEQGKKAYIRALFPDEGYGLAFRRRLELNGYRSTVVEDTMFSFEAEELRESFLLKQVSGKVGKDSACLLTELISADRRKVLAELRRELPQQAGKLREDMTVVSVDDKRRILAAAIMTDRMEPDLYLAWVYCGEGRQKELMQVLVRTAREAQRYKDCKVYLALGERERILVEKLLGKCPKRGSDQIETRKWL